MSKDKNKDPAGPDEAAIEEDRDQYGNGTLSLEELDEQ